MSNRPKGAKHFGSMCWRLRDEHGVPTPELLILRDLVGGGGGGVRDEAVTLTVNVQGWWLGNQRGMSVLVNVYGRETSTFHLYLAPRHARGLIKDLGWWGGSVEAHRFIRWFRMATRHALKKETAP